LVVLRCCICVTVRLAPMARTTATRKLTELEDSDPLLVLQRKLTQAVAEERYKVCQSQCTATHTP
jgi:hypothetical protein